MSIRIHSDEQPCIERACQRCGYVCMITISEATHIPPESFFNMCSSCMTAMFFEGADYPTLWEFFDE
ncbi:hypothetical protein HG15A2_04610 [Adhaeretor mobilis]|uniref:Uncharacterized protein n=1 Tax=Adhaeretor mobilis TaxID=1930276 RepID=A0A517MQP2_9BACT|nr:hypothetical protein HG15A2_04610 [Adhaeretor mobilis]